MYIPSKYVQETLFHHSPINTEYSQSFHLLINEKQTFFDVLTLLSLVTMAIFSHIIVNFLFTVPCLHLLPFFLCFVFFSHWFLFFFFYFPTVQQGGQVILTCMHCNYSFSPTLSSVATWVSRHSSQCYSAGPPCKSILSCVW